MPGKQTRSHQTAPAQASGSQKAEQPTNDASTRAATQKLAPWVMDNDSMSAMGLGPAVGEEAAEHEGTAAEAPGAAGAGAEAEAPQAGAAGAEAEAPRAGIEGAEAEAPRAAAAGSEGMWRQVIGERSTAVGKLGRVRAPKGVRLRKGAAAGAADLGILPFDELVSIERRTEHGWCWVISTGALAGSAGFCEEQFLAMDPPEPAAHLYRVAPGDELREIAQRAYGKSFRGGRDARLYVQALYEANKDHKGLYLTHVDLSRKETVERFEDEEHTLEIYKGAKVREGHALWLPSEAFIEQLRSSGTISDGTSVQAKLFHGLKNGASQAVDGAKYSAAFVVGVLEGAWSSIADLFQGAADMIETVAKTLYQIVTGNLGAIKDMLMGWAEKLKMAWGQRGEMAADFMAKWESEDSWTRGNFQGEVLGWVMMTALLIFATAGEAAAAMATGKWATVLHVLRAADALGDVTTYVGKAARLPGQAVATIRRRFGKGANEIGEVAGELAEEAVDAESDIARVISDAGDAGATSKRGKKGNKPELETTTTSQDGHTFHNDFRKMSRMSRHVIRQLEEQGWVRVAEIMPEDLADISKWFQKEIGVVHRVRTGSFASFSEQREACSRNN
jgi:nucleoid-associated protein YgaU